MAKKPKVAPQPDAQAPKHENPIKRFAEEVESHLIEAGELATSTTSAETNVAMAALGAIEGPGDPEPKPKKRPGAKRGKARPKAR